FAHLAGQLPRARKAVLIELRQSHESGAATAGDCIGGSVGAEKFPVPKLIERHQRRDAAGHTRMTAKRGVLRPAKVEAQFGSAQSDKDSGGAEGVERDDNVARIHDARNLLEEL